MEPRPRTPSVIARLMGLDELPIHQPVQKKRRVLSEDYLRRVASIGGGRERRSSSACLSVRVGSEGKKGLKDASDGLEEFKRENDSSLLVGKVQIEGLNRSEGDTRPISLDRESIKSDEGQGKVGVVGSKMNMFLKYIKESDSSSFNRHRLGSCHHSRMAKNHRCTKSWRITDRESKELNLKPQIGPAAPLHEKIDVAQMQQLFGLPTKSDYSAYLPSTEIVVLGPKHEKTDTKNFKSGCRRSRFAKENSARQIIKKRSQETGVTSEGGTGEVLALPDHVSRHGSLGAKLGVDACTSPIGSRSEPPIWSSESVNDYVGTTSENHKEQRPLLLKVDNVSSVNTSQQEMSIGTSEEDSVYSFCCCTDPESFVYSEESYQPSPISVLEPSFERDFSSDAECFQDVHNTNLHGLQLQLELLKSETDEYSEGTGMIVSSDDDSDKASITNHEENEKSVKILNDVEESRDYSYLVDVFTEAGSHGWNSDKASSPECPISYLVFDILEKKYGEQICWKRSDRKLLFDCINSQLAEVLQPSISSYRTKPVCRRLSYRKSMEEMKEDIWNSLTNSDSSPKLLMGKDEDWLGFGDDIDEIVEVIENSLIEELAAEIIV